MAINLGAWAASKLKGLKDKFIPPAPDVITNNPIVQRNLSNPRVAKAYGQAQQAMADARTPFFDRYLQAQQDTFLNAPKIMPRLNFAEPIANRIQNPVGRFATNFALSIPQEIANAPRDVLAGSLSLGTQAGQSLMAGKPFDVSKGLSNAGLMGQGFLNAYVPKAGTGIIKEGVSAGKKGIIKALEQGAVSGAKFGALGGAFQGLQANENQPWQYQIANTVPNVVGGALVGAGLGAGLAGGGYTFEAMRSQLKKMPEFVYAPTRDAQGKYTGVRKMKVSNSGFAGKAFTTEAEAEAAGKANQLKYELNSLKEFIDSHPAKPLLKYVSKTGEFAGGLKEVTGSGESQFGKIGDDIASELGFADSEAARASLEGLQKMRQRASEIESQLRDIPQSPKYPAQIDRTKLTGKALNYTNEQLKVGGIELPKPKSRPLKAKIGQDITQEDAGRMVDTAIYNATEGKKNFFNLFDKWIAKKEVAKTTGAETTLKYNVPNKESAGVIKELEQGVATNKYSTNIRQAYNDLFKVAEKLGKDTGQEMAYRQNYLTHIWDNTPQQIDDALARLGKKFSFANHRTFVSYDEGIKAGLTPKYSNPAQMIGEYVKKIEQTKANLGLFNDLKNNGYIVPASVGRKAGFVPIHADGFPTNSTSFNGETFTGSWYAPEEIAKEINKIFAPQDTGLVGKVFRIGAKISGGAQDILLSGGVPKTPINAFTVAQSIKELTAGRIKSPIVSIMRSISDGSTKKFFEQNIGQIKKMQEMNIPINTSFDINTVADQGTIGNMFGKSFGEVWSKVVNEPTFKRFMPMLQVNLFNDIEKGALKAGRSMDEATRLAGEAVRNFYGLGNTGKQARAKQLGKDAVSTLLFAPRYRESMLNFWINNIKALRSPLALENRTNTKFLVGATATLLAMDRLNIAINGHSMSENPDGKTDKLLIPIGGGKTLGIPFLSSVATLPRMAVNTGIDLAKGDIGAAGKELKSNISMAFRPIGDVLSNENYFGSQIYNENDTTGNKLKAAANYLINPVTGAYTHPYLREGIKLAQGKQGIAESISKATELPIRWYNTSSIENAPFWKEYANQKKIKVILQDAKYGKLDQASADKQLAQLQGKSEIPIGTKIDNGSYVAYKTSKGILFADTMDEADLAIAKDSFKQSDKPTMEFKGVTYRKAKDGSVIKSTAKKSASGKVGKTKKLKAAKKISFAKLKISTPKRSTYKVKAPSVANVLKPIKRQKLSALPKSQTIQQIRAKLTARR